LSTFTIHRVTALNDDPELHDRVVAPFSALTLTFDQTGAFKLFEKSATTRGTSRQTSASANTTAGIGFPGLSSPGLTRIVDGPSLR
jgi:hypothetical protein